MVVVPNVICVAGVFTMGFGIMASVIFNNVSAIVALANGLWPMRQVAANENKRRRLIAQAVAASPIHIVDTQSAATIATTLNRVEGKVEKSPRQPTPAKGTTISELNGNGRQAHVEGIDISIEHALVYQEVLPRRDFSGV